MIYTGYIRWLLILVGDDIVKYKKFKALKTVTFQTVSIAVPISFTAPGGIFFPLPFIMLLHFIMNAPEAGFFGVISAALSEKKEPYSG